MWTFDPLSEVCKSVIIVNILYLMEDEYEVSETPVESFRMFCLDLPLSPISLLFMKWRYTDTAIATPGQFETLVHSHMDTHTHTTHTTTQTQTDTPLTPHSHSF